MVLNSIILYVCFNIMIVYSKEGIPVSGVIFATDDEIIYPLVGGGLNRYNHLSHENWLIEHAK